MNLDSREKIRRGQKLKRKRSPEMKRKMSPFTGYTFFFFFFLFSPFSFFFFSFLFSPFSSFFFSRERRFQRYYFCMNPRRQEKTRFTISALIFHSLEFFCNNVSTVYWSIFCRNYYLVICVATCIYISLKKIATYLS